jgi:hypothetical protein
VDTFRDRTGRSKLTHLQTHGATWARSITIVFLALAFSIPARSQAPPPSPGSVVEAARSAREHQASSAKPAKIFTNDELSGPSSAPNPGSPAVAPVESSSTSAAEAPKPPSAGCDNPDAGRLKTELQSTQEEQDQIRHELSYNPNAISGGDVDMKNFKPGSSGVSLGSPPLIETKPPIPARITEVSLDEKIASMRRAVRIACESPKDGAIQAKLDEEEQQLTTLQREFDLDRNEYYSQTNFAADTAAKAKLDAEQQQIQDLQSEIERLKDELAASKANPSAP